MIAGTEVSHYRLIDCLGVGGMGEVFRAEDLRLGRQVALKFMKREFLDRPEFRLRFEFEARAVALLNHPNITTVYEFDSEAGFIAFEFVEGATLEGRMMGGALDLDEALRIGSAVCRALSHAHGRNVIHRDLKPSNILLGAEGEIKLTDFGLALVRDRPGHEESGEIAGTVAYMSPEQVLGEPVDRRGDLFALGVLLYEALAGRSPWTGEGLEIVLAVMHATPPPLAEARPDLPPALVSIIDRLLAKSPEDRFASAEEVETRLLDLEAGGESAVASTASAVSPAAGSGAEAPLTPAMAPFLGRETELADFRELLSAARGGHGGALFIGGEAGSGKSRLVRTFLSVAGEEGALCLRGRSFLNEGRNFGPFVEALEEFARQAGAAGARRGTTGAAVAPARPGGLGAVPAELLERVLPAIALLVDSDSRLTLEARSREQLWHLLDSVLKEMAERMPLVLVLDDLQWADEGTLSLLSHVARNAGNSRILVVGAYRSDELVLPDGRPHPLDDFLRAAGALAGCKRQQLAPLDVEATIALLAAFQPAGTAPGTGGLVRELGRMIHRRAQGNPFFTLEIIQLLSQAQDDDSTSRETTDRAILPQSITDVLMRRILRLTPDERDLLEVAAVEGETFHSDTLQEASGLSRIVILKRLQALHQTHRLIQPATDGHCFTHGLIREVLLKQMDPELRREFHALVAQHLARGYGERADHAGRIGGHFFKGNRFAEALPYLLTASAEARRLFLNDLALEMVDRALACLDATGAAPAARHAVLRERSGLLRLLGRPEAARLAAEDAVALADRTADAAALAAARECAGEAALAQGDLPAAEAALSAAAEHHEASGSDEDLARVTRTRGAVASRRGEFDLALERFAAAQAAFQAAGDSAAAAVTHLDTADVFFRRGDYDRALEAFDTALARLESIGDKPNVNRGLKLRGNVLFLLGRRADALAAYDAALELARELKDVQAQAQIQANLGNVHLVSGRLEEADAAYAEALARFREIGDQLGAGQSLLALGNAAYLRGRYREAAQRYEESLEPRRAVGDRPGLANALDNLGVMKYLLGEWGAALEHGQVSLDLRRQLGDRRGRAESALNLGNVRAVLGDVAEAAALYAEALTEALDLGDSQRTLRARFGQVVLALWSGDDAAVEAGLSEASALETADPALQARLRLLHACRLARQGATEAQAAAGLAVEATSLAATAGARPEEVAARFARSLALERAGYREAAATEAVGALEGLSGFDMPLLEMELRDWLKALDAAGPDNPPRLAALHAWFAEAAPQRAETGGAATKGRWPALFPQP